MKTYDEWRACGYTVKLGEKATKIGDLHLFSEGQVKRWSPRPRYRKQKYDGFYEQYRKCRCRR